MQKSPSDTPSPPKAATAEKGERILAMLVDAIVPLLVQLSNAKEGDFPFVIRRKAAP